MKSLFKKYYNEAEETVDYMVELKKYLKRGRIVYRGNMKLKFNRFSGDQVDFKILQGTGRRKAGGGMTTGAKSFYNDLKNGKNIRITMSTGKEVNFSKIK